MQFKLFNSVAQQHPQQHYDFEKGGVPAKWGSNTTGPRLWGQEDGKIVLGDKPTALAVSPDGALIAVAVISGIFIYDAVKLTLQKSFHAHKGYIDHLEFHPKGNVLVSGSQRSVKHLEAAVHLWDVSEEESDDIGPLVDILMNASTEEFIKKRGWLAKEVNAIEPAMREGLRSIVWAAEIQRRPRNVKITSVTEPGSAHNYEYIAKPGSQAFSDDGNFLFYISHHDIVVYDVKQRGERLRLRGHQDYITWVGSSPDNRLLASTSMDGTVKLWRLDDGALVNTFLCDKAQMWTGKFSPDGQILAASGSEVLMWDVYSGKLLRKLGGPAHWIRTLDFTTGHYRDNDDQTALYIATGGDNLRVFDARTGKRVQIWGSEESGFPRSSNKISEVKYSKGESTNTSTRPWCYNLAIQAITDITLCLHLRRPTTEPLSTME